MELCGFVVSLWVQDTAVPFALDFGQLLSSPLFLQQGDNTFLKKALPTKLDHSMVREVQTQLSHEIISAKRTKEATLCTLWSAATAKNLLFMAALVAAASPSLQLVIMVKDIGQIPSCYHCSCSWSLPFLAASMILFSVRISVGMMLVGLLGCYGDCAHLCRYCCCSL